MKKNIKIKYLCAFITHFTNISRWGYAMKRSLQQGSVWLDSSYFDKPNMENSMLFRFFGEKEIKSYVSEVREAIGCGRRRRI